MNRDQITGRLDPEGCCGGGGNNPDTESLILCDVVDDNVVGTSVAVYNYVEGVPDGPPTFIDPTTGDPYVPQGILQPCDQPTEHDVEHLILCDESTDGTVTRFIRHLVYDGDNGALNQTLSHDSLLDGTPYTPAGVVVDCAVEGRCTPSPARALEVECGPGEDPDREWISTQGQSSDSRVDTDVAADGLCGGQWIRPETGQNAPFPVQESFRNATFDQPGPVTQGTDPYFHLTADPANHGAGNPATPNDGPGEGWGRFSGRNSFTNGMWQVPTPFPTDQGMTMEATLASHTGTNTLGDGSAIAFTDGGVPPQSTAIGGGGSLGLGNWEGGYVAVVLDEYGGTPANANSISIQGIGPTYPNVVAQVSTAPSFMRDTTRAQPARVRTSIIEQFGQTFVSASVDWNDGNGYVQYFDRVRVDDVLGPAPASLRMAAYGGSGGAYRSVKEIRDAEANQGGVQWWRQFPITLNDGDPIDECIETIDFEICVDHTFDSASQATGDGEPEAWLWLVDTATDTIVAQTQWSSNPNNVGVERERCITLRDVDPVDVPNLRIVVGAETRDNGETFAHSWNNLRVTATGQGCPAEPVRTQLISAPCPIPVVVVGGGDGEGGGGGVAVFEAPATFAYAEICVTDANGDSIPGLLREQRDPDGNNSIAVLGQNGEPITDFQSWLPGPCPASDTTDDECLALDDGTIVWRRVTVADDGAREVTFVDSLGAELAPQPTGPFTPCDDASTITEHVIPVCVQNMAVNQAPSPDAVTWTTWKQVTTTSYSANGTPTIVVRYYDDDDNEQPKPADSLMEYGPCYRRDRQYLPACVTLDTGDTINAWRVVLNEEGGPFDPPLRFWARAATPADAPLQDPPNMVGITPADIVSWTPGFCPETPIPSEIDVETVVMCDNNGSTFFRHLVFAPDGTVQSSFDTDDDGTTITPANPVSIGACSGPDVEVDETIVCRTTAGGATDSLILVTERVYPTEGGAPTVTRAYFDAEGTAVTPAASDTLTVGECPGASETFPQLVCYSRLGERFQGWLQEDGLVYGQNGDLLNPQPQSFQPGPCFTLAWLDHETAVLCDFGNPDGNGEPTQFMRRWTSESHVSSQPTVTDYTLNGTFGTYTTVGPVGVCDAGGTIRVDDECLSDDNGVFFRRTTVDEDGNVSVTNVDIAGNAYAPVGTIEACSGDSVPLPQPITVQSHGELVTNATWTPGASVAGTALSVSLTVLSGTATVADSNGTVIGPLPAGTSLSWSVNDDGNVLDPPDSITANGGQTLVSWTERA